MFKKIIVVTVGPISRIPPIRSLLEGLAKQEYEILLLTTNDAIRPDDTLRSKITVIEINEAYDLKVSMTKKFTRMITLRKKLWSAIDMHYDQNTVLWVLTDLTVKILGKELMNKKYFLHLYELIEKKHIVPRYKLGDMQLQKYAQKAVRVVVPEYNRAHITKAWWDLKEVPFVLENKPFYPEMSEEKDLKIKHSQEAEHIIEAIKDKKIILYQGILHKERPLDSFITAVDKLGSDYAFVVMSGGDNIYCNTTSKNYYFIPYMEAPYHLEVTSHAFIGVLSYVPTKTTNSILNAVFCAPNKTFEYSRYAVPMISNDVPALEYVFSKHKCGVCANIDDSNSICNSIRRIAENYEEYSRNARAFYESVDYEKRIVQLLNEAENGKTFN